MAKKETKEVKSVRRDLKKFKSIAVMARSEGAEVVRDLLIKDMKGAIESIAFGFKNMSHIELVASCATLKERLTIFSLHINAQKNVDLTDELLKEILANTEEEEEP